MKACNQCGKYCLHYSDGGLSATAEEIEVHDLDAPEQAQIALDQLMADSRPPLL